MENLKAIFVDFDGLMLDTEVACYAGWRFAFEIHGLEYSLEEFQQIVGTDLSPRPLLEERLGKPVDWDKVDPKRREHELSLGRTMELKVGVLDLLHSAQSLGLKLAVVSSSPHNWVDPHLEKRGVIHYFDTIVCREDAEQAKPAPDLYLEALKRLELSGDQVIAFEDSRNGSLAAKRAGLWCVAVPNEITCGTDFSHADLVTEDLTAVDLTQINFRIHSP